MNRRVFVLKFRKEGSTPELSQGQHNNSVSHYFHFGCTQSSNLSKFDTFQSTLAILVLRNQFANRQNQCVTAVPNSVFTQTPAFQSDSGISPSTRTEATIPFATTCPEIIRLATAVSYKQVLTWATLSSIMAPLTSPEKKISPHSTFDALLSVLLPSRYTTIM